MLKKLIQHIREQKVTGEQLHDWYLEITKKLNPDSYNEDAQEKYEDLTDEQKEIDNFIADKVNKQVEGTKEGVEVAEPDTETETTPDIETVPSKPNSPLKPHPGISPKPKALNKDTELFLRRRNVK